MLELLSTAAALGAEFLKEREGRPERVSAQEFREWMERVAFPVLLSRADSSLETLISMKASSAEQLGRIESKLNEIHQLVIGSSGQSQWQSLAALDRQILEAIFRDIKAGVDVMVDDDEMARDLGVTSEILRPSIEYLDEIGLLQSHAYLGGKFSISAMTTGILLAWSAVEPDGLQSAMNSIATRLCNGDSHRIGDLAEHADISTLLADALIENWADQGLLEQQRYDGGRDHSLVYNVTQQFIRRVREGAEE